MNEFFKKYADAEISFDPDRNYTCLEAMTRYSKKLETQCQQYKEMVETCKKALKDCRYRGHPGVVNEIANETLEKIREMEKEI